MPEVRMQKQRGKWSPPLAASDQSHARRRSPLNQRGILPLPVKNRHQRDHPDRAKPQPGRMPRPLARDRWPLDGHLHFLAVSIQLIGNFRRRQSFRLQVELPRHRRFRHPAGFAHREDYQPVIIRILQARIVADLDPFLFRFSELFGVGV